MDSPLLNDDAIDAAIDAGKARATARGATEATVKRAAHVAWRIADPAGWHQAEADKKREKAQEKAFFLYFATARPEVERACKKAVLAWKAAERAAHAKDAPRAAQLAARASTLAKMALAKEAVFLALPTEFERNVDNFKKYLSPFVAEAAEAAVLAQQAAVRAAM
jgi:hypothetical protein